MSAAQRLWPKLRACAGPAGDFEAIAARVQGVRESAELAASLARDPRRPRYEHALEGMASRGTWLAARAGAHR